MPAGGWGACSSPRKTRTAATASAFALPNPTRSEVRPTSTTPIPPGVIGIDPRRRITDHAANASTTLTSPPETSKTLRQVEEEQEHREVSGERGQGENVPSPPEQLDRAVAKRDQRIAGPPHRLPADEAKARGDDLGREVPEPARRPRPGWRRARPERRRRDDEDGEADQGDALQERVLGAGQRQERKGDDGEPEQGELVPEPGDGHGEPDLGGLETPAPEDGEEESAIPTAAPPGAM